MAQTFADTYLADVVAQACKFLGFKDATGAALETDAEVRIATAQAYAAIKGFIHREIRQAEITEVYKSVWEEMILSEFPVEQVISLKIDDDILQADLDYKVYSDRVFLLRSSDWFVNQPIKRVFDVTITYIGGLSMLADNDQLFSAVMLQAMSVYHRRRLYGVRSQSSGSGNRTISVADNAGGVVEEVSGQLMPMVRYSSPWQVSRLEMPPYFATDIENLQGGTFGGDISYTWRDDSSRLTVYEQAEAPGFDVHVKIPKVAASYAGYFFLRGYYTGTDGHLIKLNIYKFSTSSYEALTADATDWSGATAAEEKKFVLPLDLTGYVSPRNDLAFQIVHVSAGNAAHEFHIEYLAVVE